MKERLKKRFFEVSQIIGVSADEVDIVKHCRDVVAPLASKVEVRPDGTLIATFEGSRTGPKVMVDAHVDEIGIMVKYIDPNGFIFFEAYNMNMKVLMGTRIIFKGAKGNVIGVMGLLPGHIMTAAESNSIPPVSQSFIDVGAKSRAEVLEMGIDIGTTGVYEAPVHEMYNKDIVVSRAVDNRMGVSYLLELAHDLNTMDFAGSICLTFSTIEEIAALGAAHASNYLQPDYAIVLDTIPAGGVPGVSEQRLPVFMGKGPVISFADASGTGAFKTHPNRRLVAATLETAAEQNIPMQKMAMYSTGGYITNTSGISRLGNHCPSIAIATPRRYSHSPIEMVDLNDCVCSYTLLRELVRKNGTFSTEFLDD